MAKLKMPSKELGTEMSPVSPDLELDEQEQGGEQEPTELIDGTNIDPEPQVDVTEADLTEDNSIVVTEAFNCYYSGQFVTFKKNQEIEDPQLVAYLIESGAPVEAKAVE